MVDVVICTAGTPSTVKAPKPTSIDTCVFCGSAAQDARISRTAHPAHGARQVGAAGDLGGIPGLAIAAFMAFMLREKLANFIPGFVMTPGIAIAGVAMMLALGLITGMTALNAMRLKIATALGRG